MAKQSPAKRMEGMVIGMGFLLMKLKSTYGHDFGSGMTEQVNQALRDYQQVCASARQREESASAVLAKLPPKPPEVQ